MYSLTSLSGLVALVCLTLAPTCRAQITCYNCTTDLFTGGDSASCANPGSGTPTVTNCNSCSLSVGYASFSGVPVYTRGCGATTTPNNVCTGGVCYCNSGLCNTNTFSTLGSLQCYSCSSVNNIDNGCGRVLNPNSIYVTKQSGCTACGLTITPSSPVRSGGGWTRSCLHDIDVDNTCSNNLVQSCSFRCTTNLCNTNSAPLTRQVATSTLGAALALVAAAMKLA